MITPIERDPFAELAAAISLGKKHAADSRDRLLAAAPVLIAAIRSSSGQSKKIERILWSCWNDEHPVSLCDTLSGLDSDIAEAVVAMIAPCPCTRNPRPIRYMLVLINQRLGRIHHDQGQPALAKTRPVYAFIPEEFFGESGFCKSRYLVSRWPSINCGANPLSVGSHVIPEPSRPVQINCHCPILAEFIRRLETFAEIKAPAAA